jgi:hypothetical protein
LPCLINGTSGVTVGWLKRIATAALDDTREGQASHTRAGSIGPSITQAR